MKIALYHNLTSGGSKREAYEFARQFVCAGHTLLTFAPSTAEEKFLPLKEIAHETHTFPLPLIPELPLRIPGFTRYIDLVGAIINLRRQMSLSRRIAAEIDSANCDFVFVHHDRTVKSPYLLRYLKTRSAYYCAEPTREFYDPPIPRPYHRPLTRIGRLQRVYYTPARWVQRGIVKRDNIRNVQYASLLLTNSFFSAESIYRAYNRRARVVYLGVDVEKFRRLNLERQNFVLSVGAVSPLKGYDFLIEALGHLPETSRPRLLIVGNSASDGEKVFLNNLAERCRVEVEFCVNVSDDELVKLYNQARAFVYSPVLEPFGLAPLEAMACGTPVIAVKEGGVRESVREGKTGCLVPRAPGAFAQALALVLGNPSLAKSLGENGRKEVERFWTWDKAYGRLMQNVAV